jgi:putrescine oxidase
VTPMGRLSILRNKDEIRGFYVTIVWIPRLKRIFITKWVVMNRLERDVVIVGAGATGLTAATHLHNAGHSVIVLEARDRVGGRLWTNHIEGQMLEIGGQWVSPDQTVLLDTLDALGLKTYERFRDGESVYIGRDGVAKRFTGDIFPASPRTESEIERLIGILDELVAQTDPAAPWEHPQAAAYDHISFRAWLEQQSDDEEARENVALFIADAMLTKPAHAFSLLQALLMAASAGSFSHLVDADFILDKRVVGGLQQVPLKLAAQLDSADVRLEQPVRRIRWSAASLPDDAVEGETVEVTTDDLVVTARRVIVAVPPNLYNRIEYAPNLPRLRQQQQQHQSLGLVIKVHATYETPFWREDGLSATAFSPFQLVHEAYDNTNHGETRGTLVGFVSDEKADAVFGLSASERKERILQSLAAYYGPKALDPVVYYESDWAAEEWTQGAYAASFDLGGLTRYGAMQLEPVGPMRFGSSDLAAEGYQHVDGAIRVGRRLAAETIDSLASEQQSLRPVTTAS